MRLLDKNTQSFLSLVRAGLWEKETRLLPLDGSSLSAIFNLAEEQSVVGIVAAGLEHLNNFKVPQKEVLLFVGFALLIEQRNLSMNDFVGWLIHRLQEQDIDALLVKGQGVAQNYIRPLWRAAGDIDLLLDRENYEKAKKLLFPIAESIDSENPDTLHQAISIHGVDIELHGRIPFLLSRRVDCVIDTVLENALHGGGVCKWEVNRTDVLLPSPDNHIIIVFTHYLHHFFIEGVGLRQICDWIRMLWVNRDSLNKSLLYNRLRSMGLITEWKVFAALAVETLGMPSEAMPFYDKKYSRRAYRALRFIMKRGNFGHNNDLTYREKYRGLTYMFVAFWRRLCDFSGFTLIFPVDAPKFFFTYVFNKAK